MVSVVRDGRLVAPYCTECGCRLNTRLNYINPSIVFIEHFPMFGLEIRDARGCKCSLVSYFETWRIEELYREVA